MYSIYRIFLHICHFMTYHFCTHWLPRFQLCCEKGFKAALELAELCSGIESATLERMYRRACEAEGYFTDGVFESAEEDSFEVADGAPEDSKVDQCMYVLTDVQQAQSFADPEAECNADLTAEVAEESQNLPDREDLMSLTSGMAAQEPFGTEAGKSPPRNSLASYLPDNLTDALSLPKTCVWNALFRFAIRMRHSAGGCDLGFIKNAKNCRRCSKQLNWFQLLGWLSDVGHSWSFRYTRTIMNQQCPTITAHSNTFRYYQILSMTLNDCTINYNQSPSITYILYIFVFPCTIYIHIYYISIFLDSIIFN